MMNGKAILISIIKIEILGLTLWQLASIFSPYSQNIIPNAHGSVFNKLSIAIERLSIFDTISIWKNLRKEDNQEKYKIIFLTQMPEEKWSLWNWKRKEKS